MCRKGTIKTEKPEAADRPNRPYRSKKPAYQASRKNKFVRTVWGVALLLVGVFAIGFLIISLVEKFLPWQFSKEISPDQAQKQLDSGALVVDVRTCEEFAGGHIEHSLLMPLEELNSLMSALPHDRMSILVCRSGVRSIQTRYILQEAGFTQVTSMAGGITAWIEVGLLVVYGEPVRNN